MKTSCPATLRRKARTSHPKLRKLRNYQTGASNRSYLTGEEYMNAQTIRAATWAPITQARIEQAIRALSQRG